MLLPLLQLLPPMAYLHMPASNFTTKFVIGNLNKVRGCVGVGVGGWAHA